MRRWKPWYLGPWRTTRSIGEGKDSGEARVQGEPRRMPHTTSNWAESGTKRQLGGPSLGSGKQNKTGFWTGEIGKNWWDRASSLVTKKRVTTVSARRSSVWCSGVRTVSYVLSVNGWMDPSSQCLHFCNARTTASSSHHSLHLLEKAADWRRHRDGAGLLDHTGKFQHRLLSLWHPPRPRTDGWDNKIGVEVNMDFRWLKAMSASSDHRKTFRVEVSLIRGATTLL